MTESNLCSVVDQLRKEEERLGKEQARVNQELRTVEAEMKRVRAALAALGEKTTGKAAAKPAATKKDVIRVVAEVLSDQGVVEKEALRTVVQEKLAEEGKTRQGFALRFEEALKEKKFVDSPGGYRMAGDVGTRKEPNPEKVSSPAASS